MAVPARVPRGPARRARGARRALVEAAVEVEVMATAPARARGSDRRGERRGAGAGAGLPLLARGRGTIVVGRRLPRTPYSRCRCVGPSRSLPRWRRRSGTAPSPVLRRPLPLAAPPCAEVCPPSGMIERRWLDAFALFAELAGGVRIFKLCTIYVLSRSP